MAADPWHRARVAGHEPDHGAHDRPQTRTLSQSLVACGVLASYLGVCDGRADHRRALKHGVKERDILHAYRNPIRIWDLGDGFTMTVGATATATILEVGYIQGETAVVTVHAMRARERFLG